MNPKDHLGSLAHLSLAHLESALPPVMAHTALGGADVGAVVGENGAVIGTVTDEDLVRATQQGARDLLHWSGLAPVVVVDASSTLAELADSDAITLLDLGVPRIIVVEGDRPTSALPVSVVEDYLASAAHPRQHTTMGPHGASADASLAGRPQVGAARVVCRHPDCGHVNTLVYYDPRRPPQCTNLNQTTHTLVIRN